METYILMCKIDLHIPKMKYYRIGIIVCNFPFVPLSVSSFLFNIVCSVMVGTGEVRLAHVVASEVSGTH